VATLPRVYRYRLHLSADQERHFLAYAGARRFVYNWALARRKAHFAATGSDLSVAALCRELTLLKQQPATAWLQAFHGQMLQQPLHDLQRAFAAFFARRAAFPRFRSRKRDRPTFRFPQFLRLRGDTLLVPKLGPVPLVLHRPTEGELKSASFARDASGAWYVALTYQMPQAEGPLVPPAPERSVGVDLGLRDLAVLSDGSHIAAPRYYRRAERRLRRLQRQLSRCRQGSANRERVRHALARQHQRVTNQRRDHLEKLSAQLVRGHDLVCIGDLNVRGLARTKLAKSVYDAGWGLLRRKLSEKAQRERKHLVVVGRWYASTRTCAECGWKHPGLGLSDREWRCRCGRVHQRDENAARNIRSEGLRLLLAGGTPESQNAPRGPVSPAERRHGSLTGEAPPQAVG
jgi:putative transposase